MDRRVKDLLRNVYKTYNSKLDSEPYNLKALVTEKQTDLDNWQNRILPAAIRCIY